MDRHIAVAGTAPISPTGRPTTVLEQTRLCLAIVRRAIEAAGGDLRDVTRTRVLLTDIATWREAAQAHGEVFADIRPACTFAQVVAFIDPAWRVEIEAEAVISSPEDLRSPDEGLHDSSRS